MAAPAPFFADLADGPNGGQAVWLHTADGVRLRVGWWPAADGVKVRGTVLILPGRTEYIEKYGPAAHVLAARGYACAAIDWRGQGLADHRAPDPAMGHVDDFDEYQTDLAAVLAHLDTLALPGPRFVLAHSMGGVIALRAIYDGLAVQAAAFTAPMWGIRVMPWMRPFARPFARLALALGRGFTYAPTTQKRHYLDIKPFRRNKLTTDRPMWDWMRAHLSHQPGLSLGGPSLIWLNAAFRECDGLALRPAPDLPAICALGGDERIVSVPRIRARMAGWARGRLVEYPGAQHEVLMEGAAVREGFLHLAADLFDAAG